MIIRKHTKGAAQPLQQASTTAMLGVDGTKAPTSNNTVRNLVNLDANLDGSLSLRKPLLMAHRPFTDPAVGRYPYSKFNTIFVKYLFDKQTRLVVFEYASDQNIAYVTGTGGTESIVSSYEEALSQDNEAEEGTTVHAVDTFLQTLENGMADVIDAYHAKTNHNARFCLVIVSASGIYMPIKFKYTDGTGVFQTISNSGLYACAHLNLKHIEAFNTNSSTILGNVTVDLTRLDPVGYNTLLMEDAVAAVAPRYLRIYKDASDTWSIEVMEPEVNIADGTVGSVFKPNATLDNAYALRDSYNDVSFAIDHIAPFMLVQNSNGVPVEFDVSTTGDEGGDTVALTATASDQSVTIPKDSVLTNKIVDAWELPQQATGVVNVVSTSFSTYTYVLTITITINTSARRLFTYRAVHFKQGLLAVNIPLFNSTTQLWHNILYTFPVTLISYETALSEEGFEHYTTLVYKTTLDSATAATLIGGEWNAPAYPHTSADNILTIPFTIDKATPVDYCMDFNNLLNTGIRNNSLTKTFTLTDTDCVASVRIYAEE